MTTLPDLANVAGPQPALLQALAGDIRRCGYSMKPQTLPPALVTALLCQARATAGDFDVAGIGRQHHHHVNHAVRRDHICWIEGRSEAERQWLAWAESLRLALNRELLLGLFDFESHFAHYPPGAFYRRHLDSFHSPDPIEQQGAQRVLSVVAYLNPAWGPDDGGELIVYRDEQVVQRVTPLAATVVCFLSRDVPHEVLPARRDRYSIAGWFRINGSLGVRIDPPR